MNLYGLSNTYTNPAVVLNKCRELQTPAEGLDLTNWLRRILGIESIVIVMKDHPFFGDQIILPVCGRKDYPRPSLWSFDPSRWNIGRGTLCKDFSRSIYPEESYALGPIIQEKARAGGPLGVRIDEMDLSLHKIFEDDGLFKERPLPGFVMRTATIYVRYFLYDGHIFCMLKRIRIRAQNRMHTVFDFEQIARNYDHDQVTNEGSIEVETVQDW